MTRTTRTSNTPYITKAFEASTCHITKHDTELLGRDDCAICAYSFEYGWFIFTGSGGYDQEEYNGILAYGFSEALVNLLKTAAKHDCKFLCLDCDGFTYDDLPQYKW